MTTTTYPLGSLVEFIEAAIEEGKISIKISKETKTSYNTNIRTMHYSYNINMNLVPEIKYLVRRKIGMWDQRPYASHHAKYKSFDQVLAQVKAAISALTDKYPEYESVLKTITLEFYKTGAIFEIGVPKELIYGRHPQEPEDKIPSDEFV